MLDNTTTTILAIFGAVVSSFAVGWNFYRDLTDRGKLRVSCYIGKIATPGVGIDPKNYLVWNVTNIGRQPVLLTHIGGENKDQENFLLNTLAPLPKMLQPGEYTLDYVEDLSVLSEKLKALTATDSLDRTYRAPKKQVRKLKEVYASGKYSKSDN